MTTDNPNLRDAALYQHWTDVTIRYCDQDPMGHINNVAITGYIEAARTEYIYSVLKDVGETDVEFVLANLNVNFHEEFVWPGTVRVGARIIKVGNKSFASGYSVFKGETCHVTATCVSVFFDMASRKSTQPPTALRELLQNECP